MNSQSLRASAAVMLAALAMSSATARADLLLVVDETSTAPASGDILQYNLSTGALVGSGPLVPNGSGGVGAPTALAIGPGGNLFVADASSSSIIEYNAQGVYQGVFVSSGSWGLSDPTSLAFGPDGNLYVSSYGTSSVLEYSGTTGAYIQTLGGYSGAGGLSGPAGLTFFNGNLYVASQGNGEVLEYNFTTEQYSTFVQEGSGGLSTPSGLAFGPDGNLYVADEGNSEILSYDGTTGSFDQTFVYDGEGGLSTPTALAFESNGTLLVASGSVGGLNGAILDYDSSGNLLSTLVPNGSGGLVAPLDLGLAVISVPEPSSAIMPLIVLTIAGAAWRISARRTA